MASFVPQQAAVESATRPVRLLSIAGRRCVPSFLEMPTQARLVTRAERARQDSHAASTRGSPPRVSCRSSARTSRICQQQLESLRPILPEEKDAADLLRRVHTLAMESNLTIRGFKPQAIATRELHAEWPISLELEGTYHNLGAFLDRVSKVPRIINVSGLSIPAGPKGATATVAVTCTATTFVLLDTPAADTAAGQERQEGDEEKPHETPCCCLLMAVGRRAHAPPAAAAARRARAGGADHRQPRIPLTRHRCRRRTTPMCPKAAAIRS